MLAWILQPAIVSKLIRYLLMDESLTRNNPKALDALQLRLEYAELACSIFTFDAVMTGSLFGMPGESAMVQETRNELVHQFFSFLDRPPPLPRHETGFFCDVLRCMLKWQPTRVHDYVRQHPNVLDALLMHVDNEQVLKLLMTDFCTYKQSTAQTQALNLIGTRCLRQFLDKDDSCGEVFDNLAVFLRVLLSHYRLFFPDDAAAAAAAAAAGSADIEDASQPFLSLWAQPSSITSIIDKILRGSNGTCAHAVHLTSLLCDIYRSTVLVVNDISLASPSSKEIPDSEYTPKTPRSKFKVRTKSKSRLELEFQVNQYARISMPHPLLRQLVASVPEIVAFLHANVVQDGDPLSETTSGSGGGGSTTTTPRSPHSPMSSLNSSAAACVLLMMQQSHGSRVYRIYQFVKLLGAMVRASFPLIDNAFLLHGVLRRCVELFAAFPSHSILHAEVASLLTNVLQTTGRDSLVQNLLLSAQLPRVIVAAYSDMLTATTTTTTTTTTTDACSTSTSSTATATATVAAAYRGHFVPIARAILNQPLHQAALPRTKPENRQWYEFVDEVLPRLERLQQHTEVKASTPRLDDEPAEKAVTSEQTTRMSPYDFYSLISSQ